MELKDYKVEGSSFIHSSGRSINLFFSKGDIDESEIFPLDKQPFKEDMYVVHDKFGYDLAGEYMTLEQAFSTVLDDIAMEEESGVRC